MTNPTDRYQILEKTPHTAEYYPDDPFQPMPEWQLQTAEYDLKVNKHNYYEHVSGTGNTLLYPADIAQRIAAYWRQKWPWAEFKLRKDGIPVDEKQEPQAEYYTDADRKKILTEGEAAYDAEQEDQPNLTPECPYDETRTPIAWEIWWNGYRLARDQANGTAPTWLDERD